MKQTKVLQLFHVLAIILITISYFSYQSSLLFVAIGILLVPTLFPGFAVKIEIVWKKIGGKIGALQTYILLSLLFLTTVLPLRLFTRKKNGFPSQKKSNWVDVQSEKVNFEKPW
jgi:hypothetical protein